MSRSALEKRKEAGWEKVPFVYAGRWLTLNQELRISSTSGGARATQRYRHTEFQDTKASQRLQVQVNNTHRT